MLIILLIVLFSSQIQNEKWGDKRKHIVDMCRDFCVQQTRNSFSYKASIERAGTIDRRNIYYQTT